MKPNDYNWDCKHEELMQKPDYLKDGYVKSEDTINTNSIKSPQGLIEILLQYNDWKEPVIDIDLNYSGCYYEGDKPEIEFKIYGYRPKTEKELAAEKKAKEKIKAKNVN